MESFWKVMNFASEGQSVESRKLFESCWDLGSINAEYGLLVC